MTKRNRRIILAICAILFLIITPYVALFSLGYRVDFEKLKIVATGGIYIKAFPKEVDVIIDSRINNKTGLFSNSFFVQNLLPTIHNVLIKKEGYYDYRKNIEVKEKEVTKLEYVVLFKKNIIFEIITDKNLLPSAQKIIKDKFVIKNNNLYYSDIRDNSEMPQIQKNTPVLKNIIEYKISKDNIIWLGLDGFLYSSDSNGKNTEKLSMAKLKIDKQNSYQIAISNQKIFLKEGANLLLFNQETKSFKNFYNVVKDVKISPDGQKLLYYNDYEISFSNTNQDNPDKVFLNRFSEKVGDCYWINNDYVIFTLGDKIIISEIYNEGNLNMVSLPQTISLLSGLPAQSGKNLEIIDAQIFFNQQDRKLYILTGSTLLRSEELIS